MGRFIFLVLVLLSLSLTSEHVSAQHEPSDDLPDAIEFQTDIPWLNVSRPLSLEDLRGKIVILDFWTYGCINCIHVLEDFDRLQEKYGDKIAIIGVHTPKFDNEKNLETLRRIVVRYGISHPVVNDVDFRLARLYGMRAWPTQFVITPNGQVLGKVTGEGNYEVFEQVIDLMLEQYADKISTAALPIALEKDNLHTSYLAYPGKIAASAQYVAISDTAHHRIVITDHTGKLERTIGGAGPGFEDGSAEKALFLNPQGLAFLKDTLYVADTGNHSIRAIDLSTGEVKTVAGTGKIRLDISDKKRATKSSLRSPWDLAAWNEQILVAMAGNHQIWALNLKKNTIRPFSGNGREALKNGPRLKASYSQPSGLSMHQNKLYVADSESSAIREIDLETDQVSTLVGTGLFDFGDEDGDFSDAVLQHVLGVAALNDQQLFIADTYNHKLKILDLDKRTVQTIAGDGTPGDTNQMLNEPGGLAVLNQKILIADTNNHRIMQYDPASGNLDLWPILLE